MSVEIILGNTELCRDVRVQFCRLVSHHLVRRRWREGGDGERGRRWREGEVMEREKEVMEREGGDGERGR